jgi:hypothetical protein
MIDLKRGDLHPVLIENDAVAPVIMRFNCVAVSGTCSSKYRDFGELGKQASGLSTF